MIEVLLLLVTQTILTSVPFVLAALGGTASERSGVVNIALEGILLSAAFVTAVMAHVSGDAFVGLIAGVGAGALVGLLHAFLSVTVKVDQIISGLAINIFAAGATEYGMHLVWSGSASRQIPLLPKASFGLSGGVGDLLDTLFGQPLVVATLILVPLVWALEERTRFGLRLRATGENPAATDTAGVSVTRIRYSGVVLSGLLAGLGGAWLVFNIGQFLHGMSAGKGYIAMAAVVCGRWSPLGATLACLLFGVSGAIAAALERSGVSIPSQIVSTLPYVLTIVAVAGFVGRARAPAALGVPYTK
ncbi:MAG: ABC transporter permease [Deltaproteobacteria bacterium]|nr:ABC transporter permease [Deltaproteobacteria bacterium]